MHEAEKKEEWEKYLLTLLETISAIPSCPNRRPIEQVRYTDHLTFKSDFKRWPLPKILSRLDKREFEVIGTTLHETEDVLILFAGGPRHTTWAILKPCIFHRLRLDTVGIMELFGFILYSFIQILDGCFDELLLQNR